MNGVGAGVWPYLFIVLAGFAATDLWRILGVFLSARIDEDSEVLLWVRAVATALVAGLVARLVIYPVGDLASTALTVRLAAAAIGIATFFIVRRNMLAGILAGEAALLAAVWLVPG
ncbi:AzlD domain-containing protein [Microbaculum marinum]|uniref:AzlD domain-containing protein n=1 Tax=Microbaculum marinum TaxID=1764581 RepID=A0AAW9S1C9_9HYPH